MLYLFDSKDSSSKFKSLEIDIPFSRISHGIYSGNGPLARGLQSWYDRIESLCCHFSLHSVSFLITIKFSILDLTVASFQRIYRRNPV